MISKDEILPLLKKCVLCGSCKAECPTYFLDHRESRSPRGRIYLLYSILQGDIKPSKEVAEKLFSCLLCGACEYKCPAGVDIMLSLYYGRELLKEYDLFYKNWGNLLSILFKHRGIGYKLINFSFPFLRKYLKRRQLLPENFEFEGYRFSQSGDIFLPSKDITKRGRVVLFKGCMAEFVYPQLGEAFVRVANNLGYEVVTLRGEQCCGAPLLGMGLTEEAVKLARKNLSQFRKIKADAVVSLCPTCVKMLLVDYKKIAGDSIEIMDATNFLIDKVNGRPLINIRALYHDPCHSLYGLKQYDEPRWLLKKIGVELSSNDTACCGLAGTYSLRYPKSSQEFLSRNVEAFNRTGADIVVTSCPGCIFQFLRGLKQDQVFHIIEIIDEYLNQEA